jgi:hypothetical protein
MTATAMTTYLIEATGLIIWLAVIYMAVETLEGIVT